MKYSVHPVAKISHFVNQGFKITGVIHIGANDGEEVPSYMDMGIENIICFEPIPEKCDHIVKNYTQVVAVNCAVGDKNKYSTLYLTDDDSLKGSSLLKDIDKEKKFNFQKQKSGGISCRVIRMDSFLKNRPDIMFGDFNCVVIDTQGYELNVLKGFGDDIRLFDFWNIECSRVPVYEGEAAAEEVSDFMDKNGFIRDSPIEDHNDVFFVSKKIKSNSEQIFLGGVV